MTDREMQRLIAQGASCDEIVKLLQALTNRIRGTMLSPGMPAADQPVMLDAIAILSSRTQRRIEAIDALFLAESLAEEAEFEAVRDEIIDQERRAA